MKKVILTYGLISGVIVGGLMFITIPLVHNGTIGFENGMLVGYTTMVIALSVIFFGVRSYRDNYSNGVVSFWKACQVGLLITLIAGILYGLAWEVMYSNIGDGFMQQMNDNYMAKLEAENLSASELMKKKETQAMWMDYYKNPLVRFGITFFEILPVGVLITLISALLLKRKDFLPSDDKTTLDSYSR